MQDELFPTEFARTLGEECGLLEKHKKKMDMDKYIQRNFMMQQFQQMAMASEFKDCLIIFHGVELKRKHLEALAIIYMSTRPWTLGHATKVLLMKLQRPTLSGIDAKNLTEAIVEHLRPENADGKGKGKGGGTYIVNLAKVED